MISHTPKGGRNLPTAPGPTVTTVNNGGGALKGARR
jgi:hypothetical protein